MFIYMKVLSILLCLLLLHQNASARKCQAGQRVSYITKECVECPEKQYNTNGEGLHCENCIECGKGSKVVTKCTATTDTRCKCIDGFTPIDKQNEICVCKKGSGLDITGQTCSECGNGYFSDKDDSPCRQWRECKSGTKIPGTRTSDAVCENGPEKGTENDNLKVTTLKKTTIYSAVPSRITTSSSRITASSSRITTRSSTGPSKTTTSPSNKNGIIYTSCLVIICVGILLLFGHLYTKCKVTHCIHNHMKVDSRKESICRKPVEESGEKCLSLLV